MPITSKPAEAIEFAPCSHFPRSRTPGSHWQRAQAVRFWQGGDPMVLTMNRGYYCPKDRHQLLGLRAAPTVFLSFYVPVSLVQQVCSEGQNRPVSEPPFIAQPIILDRRLTLLFQYLHRLLSDPSSFALKQESMLADALGCLFRSRAQGLRLPKALRRSDIAMQRAREFLDAHYAEPVSHALLSEISGLSAYHLNRLFRHKFGVPPHRYQLQRRIDRAKSLLLTGLPPGVVAPTLGFSQQSHFGEQFRRLVKVSPGRYGRQRSKNLIDDAPFFLDL